MDAEAQLTKYVATYNKSAKRNGLPIYADPVPVGKLSDLLDADTPRYMTPEQCAKFREEFFRQLLDDPYDLSEHGFNFRQSQRNKAKKGRGKVSDDGETLGSIISGLALTKEFKEHSARELWPRLFAKLQEHELDPEDQDCADDWKKSRYEYTFKEGTKAITGGQFANLVSDYRTGKKSG